MLYLLQERRKACRICDSRLSARLMQIIGATRRFSLRRIWYTMNKNELSAAIAAKAGLTRKDAEAAICAMSDIIAESLKNGEKVQIVGFGAFEVKERPARKARNPKTGEEIQIGARRSPMFKPGKALKEAVEG